MKLRPELFDVEAERFFASALITLTVAAECGTVPLAVVLVGLAETLFGWAASSAAVGQLYRRQTYAASRVGKTRHGRSLLPDPS